MAKPISQSCGKLQPAVCLSRGYGASLTSDKPQKQAKAKAAWATFTINTWLNCWLMCTAIIDGKKCVLMLCAWKSAFLKSSQILAQQEEWTFLVYKNVSLVCSLYT